MQSYFLDITTLLQIVSRQKRYGVLQAKDVPLPRMRKSIQAQIILENGLVRSCKLLSKGQILAEDSQALHFLNDVGALEWSWVTKTEEIERTNEKTSLVLQRSPVQEDASSIPRRTLVVDNARLDELSRNHRRVLSIIDGSRSVSRIYSVLSFTDPQELLSILRDLTDRGLICW